MVSIVGTNKALYNYYGFHIREKHPGVCKSDQNGMIEAGQEGH